jgi:hypothetical protein
MRIVIWRLEVQSEIHTLEDISFRLFDVANNSRASSSSQGSDRDERKVRNALIFLIFGIAPVGVI